MLHYPRLNETGARRDLLDKFRGYNHNLRVSEGEFYDMRNLTGDDYPVLSPRKQRGVYKTTTDANGLASNTSFCYVDGQDIYIGDTKVPLGLTGGDKEDKELINFGTNVIVLPDQKYVNTINVADRGNIKKGIVTLPEAGRVVVTFVDFAGNTLQGSDNHIWVGTPMVSEEEAYRNDDYWGGKVDGTYDYGGDYLIKEVYSGSADPYILQQVFKSVTNGSCTWLAAHGYSVSGSAAGAWSADGEYAHPYIAIYFEDDNKAVTRTLINEVINALKGGNKIKLQGISSRWDNAPYLLVKSIGEGIITDKRDGSKKDGIILASDSTFTLRIGDILGNQTIGTFSPLELTTPISITAPYNANPQSIPAMDFVIEAGNRLWGCRYGYNNNGAFVNEIYASELGNFKVWNKQDGTAADSYVASVGTSGAFTGAINYGGYPIFFKEDCIHKVYGDYPANYRIQTTMCRGVQKGCDKSLAIVNEILFYKGRTGVCAYDGSSPVEVSPQFGDVQYDKAVAGGLGNKYYISMREVGTDVYHMFVYDVSKGLWHKEDETQVTHFCNHEGELYYIDYADHMIHTVKGTGVKQTKPIKWEAETGILGANTPDNKYVSRIDIRMSLAHKARVSLYIEYDSMGEWEHLFTMNGLTLQSFTIPIQPNRCDHFRLKVEGVGEAKIYSISKTLEDAE